MKMNSQQSKLKGHSKGSPEREVHSDTGLPQKDRIISIFCPSIHLYIQELEEDKQSPE